MQPLITSLSLEVVLAVEAVVVSVAVEVVLVVIQLVHGLHQQLVTLVCK